MAYLTTAILKSDWLKLTAGTDATLDPILTRHLATAEAEVKAICNQPIEAETVTRYFIGEGQGELKLYYTVPVTVTTLKYRDTPTDSWTTVSSADYVVRTRQYGKTLWIESEFYNGREYELVASVGYATADVPRDVQTCAYELAKELYLMTPYAGKADRFGVSGTTEGQGGTSFSQAFKAMRAEVEQKLTPYRVWFL